MRRPKKKIRVKKQPAYHSSSEEEDDAREDAISDAPRHVEAGKAKKAKSVTSRPKPILKRSTAVPQPQPASDESDNGGIELENADEVDEVTKNTALNLALDLESSGDDDEANITSAAETPGTAASSEEDEDESEDSLSESEASLTSNTAPRPRKKKRNDPSAFATSITKILTSKLTTNKRADPVLSRSKSASDAHKTLADEKLEVKARAQIRAERKQSLEKGRVRDVLGLSNEAVDTGAVVEEERLLKRTAQRGVVKLFNAVRGAQVKGEEAVRVAREEGVVGWGKREERVNEMSKQGFLDLISGGGGGKKG